MVTNNRKEVTKAEGREEEKSTRTAVSCWYGFMFGRKSARKKSLRQKDSPTQQSQKTSSRGEEHVHSHFLLIWFHVRQKICSQEVTKAENLIKSLRRGNSEPSSPPTLSF
ncbi:unnamed protein product [Ilex paraguariensis]|uniref:Uncharacterized protein n=1 Tax=Ilex paraguariensis TaxID=185542 RepID=A0ABC8TZJ2_9AQUA